MAEEQDNLEESARFDVNEIAGSFPDHAESLFLDKYLVDRKVASARVFRVYRETPPHYHAQSDEYLYVISGKGRSGWEPWRMAVRLSRDIFCSLDAEQFMLCQRSLRLRWCSWRWTFLGEIPRISCS